MFELINNDVQSLVSCGRVKIPILYYIAVGHNRKKGQGPKRGKPLPVSLLIRSFTIHAFTNSQFEVPVNSNDWYDDLETNGLRAKI